MREKESQTVHRDTARGSRTCSSWESLPVHRSRGRDFSGCKGTRNSAVRSLIRVAFAPSATEAAAFISSSDCSLTA